MVNSQGVRDGGEISPEKKVVVLDLCIGIMRGRINRLESECAQLKAQVAHGFSFQDLSLATDHNCSCGGRDWADPKCCAVCRTWHDMFYLKAHKQA
jgi:hypothetical protein